jgi:hypothetical protein
MTVCIHTGAIHLNFLLDQKTTYQISLKYTMKETQLTRGLAVIEIAKSGGNCLRDGSRYATCKNKYSLLSNARNLCTESSKNVNYS